MKAKKFMVLLMLLCLLLFAAACTTGDDDDDSAADADDTAGDDDTADDDSISLDDDADMPTDLPSLIEALEVEWEPCSLYEGQVDDNRAECATVEMPRFWLAPDEHTFTVVAKRLLSGNKAADKQLWFLHGGPGAAGTIDYPSWMEFFVEEVPDLDAYTLDARGTGFSQFLGCPLQQKSYSAGGTSITLDEIPGCIDYLTTEIGDELPAYSTTNSAIDLGALIHHTQGEQEVFVYGASGGTFWGQRYLQYFPDQADGVIFEAIEPADGSIVFQDEYADIAVRDLFAYCQADPVCGTKLPDPETTLYALYDKLDAGHCAHLGLDTYSLQISFDYFAYYYPLHFMIPAIIYRLDRCSDDDVAALANFYNLIYGAKKSATKSDDDWPLSVRAFSEAVFFQQLASELWDHYSFADGDEILAYFDEVYETALISSGKGYVRHDIVQQWPAYADAADDHWAVTDVPMLMLNGELDPSTPYPFAATMIDHFTAPTQTFLGFPYAPHGVSNSSPMSNADPYAEHHCGMQLWFAFLDDPTAALDTSCREATAGPDFTGEYFAPYYWGTPDYWEGAPSKIVPMGANPAKQVPDWQQRQMLEQLSRQLWLRLPATGKRMEILATKPFTN